MRGYGYTYVDKEKGSDCLAMAFVLSAKKELPSHLTSQNVVARSQGGENLRLPRFRCEEQLGKVALIG